MRGLLVAGVVSFGWMACGPGAAPPVTTAPVGPDRPVVPAPPRPVAVAPAALGDEVAPVAARLTLALDPRVARFTGEIELDLTVARATDVIWLHAAPELVLSAATASRGGQAVAVERIVAASSEGIAGVQLAAVVAPGPLTVRLAFAGDYRGRDGLFVQATEAGRYVFSDFEPVDARRAFPGFDLPHWRVPYTLTVRAPDGMGAYANTAEVEATREGDWVVHRFAPTPPLPSYLVAVAVGDFAIVEVPGAAIPSRLLVPKPAGDVTLAASLLAPVLAAARRTIDRPLPWPKLDVVVVPQFGGAMENPGLVTIAAGLAIAPGTPDGRRLLAMVLAHEVAHLWFGDLVTLASWRELWLNEGLASWMADQTLVAMAAGWRDPVARTTERLEVYLEDSIAAAHPLRPAAIAQPRALFDRLSYDKGAAVIHTLDAWLGAGRVRAALAAHLDRHAWGVADSEALIAALAAIDPQLPIAAVIHDAIGGVGVPGIAAEVRCEAAGAALVLRSLPAAGPGPVAAAGPHQVVCARWGGPDAGRACTAVDGTATVALGARCPTWVLPDDAGLGYYHWQLPPRWWTALAAAPLAPAELRVAIEEVMTGLATGQAGVADATAVLAAAVASGEHPLVEPAARWLRVLDGGLPDRPRVALGRTVAAATATALARLGRTPPAHDDPDRARARGEVLALAGTLGGDRRVVRWADKTVAAWLRGKPGPEHALAAAVVVVGHRGTPARKRALLAAARGWADHSERLEQALGEALAASPPVLLSELLYPKAQPPLPHPISTALVGALLADPRHAEATAAGLDGRSAIVALFATDVPCTPPPPVPGESSEMIRDHLRPRLELAAAQCRAVVDRLAAATAATAP